MMKEETMASSGHLGGRFWLRRSREAQQEI
jgi:hypothetical protein